MMLVIPVFVAACSDDKNPVTPRDSGVIHDGASIAPTVSPAPPGVTFPFGRPERGVGAAPVGSKQLGAVAQNLNSVPVSYETGTPSLIWYATDGTVTYWKMNGPSFSGGGATSVQVPAPWRLAGSGDFNADGHPDLIWEATTDGTRAITFMTSAGFNGNVAMPFAFSPDWRIAGVADFDGNGKPDLVLANSVTKDNGVLFLNGTAWTGVFTALPKMPSLRLAAIGDMNSDNKPDMIWQDTAGVQSYVTYMNGTTAGVTSLISPNVVSSSWKIRAVADMDEDGKGDLILEDVSSGSRAVWHMNSQTRTGLSALPMVPTSQTILAVVPVQWPVTTAYVANTGKPVNSSFNLALWAFNRATCNPQPACASQYQSLAGRFTLAEARTLYLVEGFIASVGPPGAPVYVNIRADSASRPGPIIYSKGYFVGQYLAPIWVPFSQFNPVLAAGTYWVTFEPISYGNFDGYMPDNAPVPLSSYGYLSYLGPGWSYGTGSLGIRIRANIP
jgi:hypothetical protein